MSIASIAANIKQRQKIAHAGSYMQRYQDARADTVPAKVNTNLQICPLCSFEAYYKFLRCPHCGKGEAV